MTFFDWLLLTFTVLFFTHILLSALLMPRSSRAHNEAMLPQSQRDRIARIKEAVSRVGYGVSRNKIDALDPWLSVILDEMDALREHEETWLTIRAYLAFALTVRAGRSLFMSAAQRRETDRVERELFAAVNRSCNQLIERYPLR